MSVMTEEATYCAVHPDRETGLRCITCNRLMCVECAVRTPVGYRCRECVRGQQDKFYKAKTNDDLIVFGICVGLSAVAVAIVSQLPFGIWIALIAGLPIGGGISEVALRATGRRRSRNSHTIAAAGAVIGGLIGAAVTPILTYNRLVSTLIEQGAARDAIPPLSLDFIVQGMTSNIGTLLVIGIIAFAVYGRYRMKM